MTCTFEKEKLTAFYDGELETAEKAQVEAHISACSECLRELGEIKSASVLVKTLAHPRAPQAVAAGVAREIASAGRRARIDTARRAALWVTAAAAGLFVVANVLWFGAPERAAGTSTPVREPALAKAPPAEEPAPEARDGRADAAPETAAPARSEPPMARARELEEARKAPVEKQALEALARQRQAEQGAFAKDKAAELEKAAGTKGEAPLADAKAAPAAKPSAPAAPPPPAPAAAAGAAEGADRDTARRLKEESAPSAYVCESAGRPLALARAAVESYAARREAPERKSEAASGGARAAKSFGQSLPPAPLTVDLTDAEIAELSKELEKQGLKLVPASPEQAKAQNAQAAAGRPGAAVEKDQLRGAAAPSEAPAPAPEEARRRAGTRRITIYFSEPRPAGPAPADRK